MNSWFLVSAFLAGVVTFFAPCTFPLLPAYLAFIASGNGTQQSSRYRIFWNGLFFVIGFSVVFIFLGVLVGLGGRTFVHYRVWLSRLGGILIIIFGLSLMRLLPKRMLDILETERRPAWATFLKPGTVKSSFLFGAIFAFGWTPCIGPILGSILLLAYTTSTVGSGALLLAVFASGLAVPFLISALLFGWIAPIQHATLPYLKYITFAGGILLLALGLLLLTDTLGAGIIFIFRTLNFLGYQEIMNYL